MIRRVSLLCPIVKSDFRHHCQVLAMQLAGRRDLVRCREVAEGEDPSMNLGEIAGGDARNRNRAFNFSRTRFSQNERSSVGAQHPELEPGLRQ
jgi:hypothetical protein